MKAISIPVYTRLTYLRKTLASVVAAGADGYKVFIAVDPSSKRFAIDRLLKRYGRLLDLHVVRHETRLGLVKNLHFAMSLPFEHGADFTVQLEQDVIISPDALRMAEWYAQRDTPDSELCLNLFNDYRDERVADTPPYELRVADRFTSWGLVVKRSQWERYFDKRWFDEETRAKHFPGSVGWDWNIQAAYRDLGLSSLMPELSRSKHIGLGGEHTTRFEWIRDHRDERLADVPPGDYVLNSSTALA